MGLGICCEQKERYDELKKTIEKNKGEKDGLMPVMHKAQNLFGYLPIEVQDFISEEMGVSLSKIYGVATFYSQFTLQPRGKYVISMCLGTACYVKGAQDILDRIKEEIGVEVGETTKDGKFSIDATRCIGACGLAPVMMINDEVYGKLTPDHIPEILKKYSV